ncbi:phosphatase PAP2 family protein [Cloacibacillus sp.]|uniref:phosphatase PAP2 family protein n=1 Tax=Cloacibacillus sp. TaxID=2049023 RepID=UPI0025C6BCE5|nr:phosphatase PAP2 family protein [Cloacibacillus sp.]MCC8057873.1 phosphatase PAP2 family protein [Cloacibacillus sp.]
MQNFDFAVLDFIQNHLRSGAGDFLMPFISRLGDKGFIWIAAALLLVLFPRTRRLGVAVATALAIEIFLCNGLIKPLAARIRPYDINTGIQMLVARPADYSFPSGHTAASFAAASALYFRRSGWWIPAGLLAALIALSRLYLYVHFPTDVLGGAALGILSGWLGERLTSLAAGRKNKIL